MPPVSSPFFNQFLPWQVIRITVWSRQLQIVKFNFSFSAHSIFGILSLFFYYLICICNKNRQSFFPPSIVYNYFIVELGNKSLIIRGAINEFEFPEAPLQQHGCVFL